MSPALTLPGAEPPDVVLIAQGWPMRALLRAQFLEEGYDVVAADGWPLLRQLLRPDSLPRLVIVELHELSDPRRVLGNLRALIEPGRVLVVTALGTLTVDEIRQSGFHHVVRRPTSVGRIVGAAAALLGPASPKLNRLPATSHP